MEPPILPSHRHLESRARTCLLAAAFAVIGGSAPASGTSPQEIPGQLLRAKAGTELVRILHFGDSHLAAPAAAWAYGTFFRNAYGDGGPGLGLPWANAMAGVQATASRGWRKPSRKDGDPVMGLGGSFLEARSSGEWARLEGRFSRLRVHFLRCGGGGRVQILLDGSPLEEVDLASGSGALRVFEFGTGSPARAHRLELVTRNAGIVRILDVALEGGSGTTHSSLAFNGAVAAWLSELPEDLLAAQLRAESPDLVVLAFGTNEANASDFEPAAYRTQLEILLERIRSAVPMAGLVLAGPPDARLRRGSVRALDEVVQVQRTVAARAGALFVDRRRVMGGAGAIDAWRQAGLAAKDLVHLTAPGYVRLARAAISDLWAQLGQEAHFEALPALPPTPAPPLVAEPRGSAIYVFRTREGRILIVDDPRKAAGLEGEWIQETP